MSRLRSAARTRGTLPDHAPSQKTLTGNCNELLQELRAAQTGVQILICFLTAPFSNRFVDLDDLQVGTYLAVLRGFLLTTGSVVAPVAFHRILVRRRKGEWLVETANLCARTGSCCSSSPGRACCSSSSTWCWG